MRRILFSLLSAVLLFCAKPAPAAVSSALIGILSQQNSGDGSLADVVDSVVFDLDVTQAASYPGSGTTWSNLVTATGTTYDFYRGDGATSTTYPTFNGSAGSAAAYWSFDGGDYFRLKSGVNPNFLARLGRTDIAQDFWMAIAFNPANFTASRQIITNTTTGSGGRGVALSMLSTEVMNLDSLTAGIDTSATLGAALSIGAASLMIVTHDYATNTTRYWRNSVTGADVSQTFDTLTSDGTAALTIGANGTLSTFIPSGSLIYSVAMGNEYLDNTKAAAVINALCARHNRNYTGSCL